MSYQNDWYWASSAPSGPVGAQDVYYKGDLNLALRLAALVFVVDYAVDGDARLAVMTSVGSAVGFIILRNAGFF